MKKRGNFTLLFVVWGILFCSVGQSQAKSCFKSKVITSQQFQLKKINLRKSKLKNLIKDLEIMLSKANKKKKVSRMQKISQFLIQFREEMELAELKFRRIDLELKKKAKKACRGVSKKLVNRILAANKENKPVKKNSDPYGSGGYNDPYGSGGGSDPYGALAPLEGLEPLPEEIPQPIEDVPAPVKRVKKSSPKKTLKKVKTKSVAKKKSKRKVKKVVKSKPRKPKKRKPEPTEDDEYADLENMEEFEMTNSFDLPPEDTGKSLRKKRKRRAKTTVSKPRTKKQKSIRKGKKVRNKNKAKRFSKKGKRNNINVKRKPRKTRKNYVKKQGKLSSDPQSILNSIFSAGDAQAIPFAVSGPNSSKKKNRKRKKNKNRKIAKDSEFEFVDEEYPEENAIYEQELNQDDDFELVDAPLPPLSWQRNRSPADILNSLGTPKPVYGKRSKIKQKASKFELNKKKKKKKPSI